MYIIVSRRKSSRKQFLSACNLKTVELKFISTRVKKKKKKKQNCKFSKFLVTVFVMNRKRKKKKNKKNIGTNVVGRSITRTNQLAGLKINQIGFLARWYSQVYPRFSKKGFRKPVIHRGTNHSFNGLSLDAVIFLGKGIDRISTCLLVHQWESRPTFSRSEKIGSISK